MPETWLEQKFRTGEEAWFWTSNALRSRAQPFQKQSDYFRALRPCEPDDVILCLERLFRAGRITANHAHVLRRWGERQMAPRAPLDRPEEVRLWQEAIGLLSHSLRARGLIG